MKSVLKTKAALLLFFLIKCFWYMQNSVHLLVTLIALWLNFVMLQLHICPIFDMNVVLKVLVWDIETQATVLLLLAPTTTILSLLWYDAWEKCDKSSQAKSCSALWMRGSLSIKPAADWCVLMFVFLLIVQTCPCFWWHANLQLQFVSRFGQNNLLF